MIVRRRGGGHLLAAAALFILGIWVSGASAQGTSDDEAVARGAYIFRAAGCLVCHTDTKNKGKPLAGGRALATPFGTFYTPNITPDPTYGIGAWSDADFLRALHDGIHPDGHDLYPAFPYTSYTGMTDEDALDLKAYIFAQPPVAQPNRAHELNFPFGFRILLAPWRTLFFRPGWRVSDPARDAQWNRGAYLVNTLGHCAECHTPRNFLGAMNRDRAFAGTLDGPDGKKVPNITPDPKDGIGKWDPSDITYMLKSGFLPNGDYVGGAMTDVVEESTGHLSDDDRAAIAAYLKNLKPLPGP